KRPAFCSIQNLMHPDPCVFQRHTVKEHHKSGDPSHDQPFPDQQDLEPFRPLQKSGRIRFHNSSPPQSLQLISYHCSPPHTEPEIPRFSKPIFSYIFILPSRQVRMTVSLPLCHSRRRYWYISSLASP